MKYMVGELGDSTAVFAVVGIEAINLTLLEPAIGPDLIELMRNPALCNRVPELRERGQRVPLSEITPALPVLAPEKILCLGLNYVDHVKEGGWDMPDYPAFFMRGRNSIIPSGAPLLRPTVSNMLDYEAELMIVVGKGGRHISEHEALDHVFGYTVFNDGSVRDFQSKSPQWTAGKNFDSTGAIGPFVVTPDELPDGCKGLKIESRVGSEILQSSNTKNMIWSVGRTIATISEFATLAPGDLIATGTPPGVGMAKQPEPRWLLPGEIIEIEIEGIGICANPVVDERP